jgi:hypothetical protein
VSTLSRPAFDLICMGRAAVDLYGEQIGARLEDQSSFARYLGGCPANIAVGAARLGLAVAMLSRVGNEQNGAFVRETLAAEGVDVSHLKTDPQRLTALVFLSIRDRDTFPLLFYRHECADTRSRPRPRAPCCERSATTSCSSMSSEWARSWTRRCMSDWAIIGISATSAAAACSEPWRSWPTVPARRRSIPR